jgi:C-terminal processing protease CtpA/Prc
LATSLLRVRPGTDAESKVRIGDEVISYNKGAVTRYTLWRTDYYYNYLSPRTDITLVLKDPEGQQREVKVDAKIQELKRRLDLTQGNDIWDMFQLSENAHHQSRERYEEMGDVIIWKVPGFISSDAEVDHLFGIARKHKALILDLRENPGGSVKTLERMLGSVFEGDVKIADLKSRKELKPMIAKGRGKNAFTGKLVVLVDSRSASAAEIFARVIQLEHRGIVVGDRSSGSVMEAERVSEKQGFEVEIVYGFSITIADLIMKDGKSLEHVGVTPDEVVLPTAFDIANSSDPAMVRAAALVGLNLEPAQAGKLFPYEWLPW